jgi:glycosyltransferase involved in cell wall biosynthesis
MTDETPEGPVILQVLPALQGGGVEKSALEITQAIRRAGGIPLVASAGGRMVAQIERAGGEHITLPLATKLPWLIWRNAARLETILRERQVSIIHARSRAPAWSAWMAARRCGVHFVTTCHGIYGENFPFKRDYNAVMARGERVIANSHFMAETVIARHQVPPERLRVIPRGVDPMIFDPDAIVPDRLARMAASWRLPDGTPTIMLPGRITGLKGQDVLLRAMARLRHQEAVCVLVGGSDGRERVRDRLVALAAELGISDRVRLVGHCEDMPAAMMMCDVVVSASTQPEAFGRTVIEAQAMRRLVVATDHGGAVETIEHGVTGWRVPPGDADALAEMLDGLLEMAPAEREAAGVRAREAVLRNYTVRAMQDATIAVYAELLT